MLLSVFLPERQERLHRGTAALYHACYKEKKNLTTGETIIQYDRLTPKTQA